MALNDRKMQTESFDFVVVMLQMETRDVHLAEMVLITDIFCYRLLMKSIGFCSQQN